MPMTLELTPDTRKIFLYKGIFRTEGLMSRHQVLSLLS